ncbi:hypothetical protein MTR67_012914, partial [Solanum verrucosum]
SYALLSSPTTRTPISPSLSLRKSGELSVSINLVGSSCLSIAQDLIQIRVSDILPQSRIIGVEIDLFNLSSQSRFILSLFSTLFPYFDFSLIKSVGVL